MSDNAANKLVVLNEASNANLSSEISLRGQSRLLNPLSLENIQSNEQPRALRALAKIVDGGLCHRCGTCVGICPTSVLGLDSEDYPQVKNISACTDCDLCVKVCPGDEFNFHEEHRRKFTESNELESSMSGELDGDIRSTHGVFSQGLIAFAKDPWIRENSTSGGLVSAILLHLLQTKKIDGAVIIASDEKQLWKGKPIIARTPEQILSGLKSKYAIAPTNSVFDQIREIPGRYALVGLPCQVHGFLKAAKLDTRIAQRVVLSIGLFCHAAIEHEALRIIWDSLGDKTDQAERFVSRIGKHPGAPHLLMKDGSKYPVYFGWKQGYRPTSMEMINVLYRLYTPARCLTCFDALSEFADISIGDPWMAPPQDDIDFKEGFSFALVRNKRASEIIKELVTQDKIGMRELTRKESLSCNRAMAEEKRWRAFRIIETQRRQGKAIPEYGKHEFEVPTHSSLQFIRTEANILSHILCFIPRYRAAVLKFILGNGGYFLLWLNNRRRQFRFWLRDTMALISRKVLGRR